MLRSHIEVSDATVSCVGHRAWLRATLVPRNGHVAELQVETATAVTARWQRVDEDLPALIRAASRLVSVDMPAARRFLAAVTELTALPARDPEPVTGIARAVYPLLASPPPWPLAGIPPTLPDGLRPAFRCSSAREAARRMFASRATRPVVRSLCELLIDGDPPDTFALTVATALAPVLEPDVLARVLAWRVAGERARRPLGDADAQRLRRVLAGLTDARRLRLLRAGLTDAVERDRMRFVAAASRGHADLGQAEDWTAVALRVALAEAVPA